MKGKSSVVSSFLLLTQLGISVMAPVFFCIFIGYYLDSRFGWKTSLILLILGFLAGGRNGWLLIKQLVAEDKKEKK